MEDFCDFGHDEIDECDECGGCKECGTCYCEEDFYDDGENDTITENGYD